MMPAEKIGTVGDALIAGRLRAQARRLRELDAGRARVRHDPLAGLERREQARAAHHRGSVVRRLQRTGLVACVYLGTKVIRRLSEDQTVALERWALDRAIAGGGVCSLLGRDGTGRGGPREPEGDGAAWMAEGRFLAARAALYVAVGVLAGSVTERVACGNQTLSGAVASHFGRRRVIDAAEAFELLAAGADALDAHYRGNRA